MDASTRRTEAWSRHDTRAGMLAGTLAAGPGGAPTLAPASVRRRGVSALPTIELGTGGAVTLHHQAQERYRRVSVIGEGGMGVVERAEDVDIGRPIAIKRLTAEASHPMGIARFVSEVRIVGNLEHPNVAPIHDVGVDDEGRYFFVMKYVEGQTLGDVIDALAAGNKEAHAYWTHERRAEVMVAVLRALEYAHSRGIIHRDVKPDNVMIGRYGEVWLLDWGIAIKAGEAEIGAGDEEGAMPAICGTPAYMSPEQARGATLDARSDLYSASVMFHELATLRHYLAHRSDNVVEILEAVEHESPVVAGPGVFSNPHQDAPPIELQRIWEKGLAKDPALRHGSAAEMLAGVKAYLEGRNQVGCVYSFTKRGLREGGRFVDRHPRLAVGLFFAGALAAIFGAVMGIVMLARGLG